MGDFEDLHHDEDMAFVQLVEQFDADFSRRLEEADDRTDTRYFHLDHMNRILAAADALGITDFSAFEMPRYDHHDLYDQHRAFTFAVQRYVLNVRIRHARTTKIYSVSLDTASKSKIHHLVKRIREIIESADLEERKRNSLFQKLNAFEADVDRARTPFGNALLAMIDVAHVAKKGTEALKPLTELVAQINELLGGAKSGEPENQQLPPQSPSDRKKLEPPRKQIEGPKRNDADDEIPF